MTRPDPLTRQRSPWRELSPLSIAGSLGRVWVRDVHDGKLRAIIAEEPTGWHLSVSFRDHRGNYSRYPSWDEIAHVRYELAPPEIDMVMHLPPVDEYVSDHKTTFHLHESPERGKRRSPTLRPATEQQLGSLSRRFASNEEEVF